MVDSFSWSPKLVPNSGPAEKCKTILDWKNQLGLVYAEFIFPYNGIMELYYMVFNGS